MAIKRLKSSQELQSVSNLCHRIDNLLADQYLQNLPHEIKQKLQDFKGELKEYSPQQDKSKYKVIDGPILNEKQILEIIIEASGYTKWQLADKETWENKDIEKIKNDFGISFKEKSITQYMFSRSTRSRDDIDMVRVTALPGYNYVSLDTGRADFSLEGLLNPEEMIQQLAANFDD